MNRLAYESRSLDLSAIRRVMVINVWHNLPFKFEAQPSPGQKLNETPSQGYGHLKNWSLTLKHDLTTEVTAETLSVTIMNCSDQVCV
eukprot:g58434.t1